MTRPSTLAGCGKTMNTPSPQLRSHTHKILQFMQIPLSLTACGELCLPAETACAILTVYLRDMHQDRIFFYCRIIQHYSTFATGSVTKSDPNVALVLHSTEFCQGVSITLFSNQVRFQHRGTNII